MKTAVSVLVCLGVCIFLPAWCGCASIAVTAFAIAFVAYTSRAYNKILEESVRGVPRASFKSRMQREVVQLIREDESAMDESDVVPDCDHVRGHMWKTAVRVGQRLRLVLKCPRYTRADYMVAVERAQKYWDEHQKESGWRVAHQVLFVQYCALSILTPSDLECEAKEALCSFGLQKRRNLAKDERVVPLPWLAWFGALLTGAPTWFTLGAESPKVVA